MRNLLIALMLGSTAMTGATLAQEAAAPAIDSSPPTDTASQMEGGFITWQGQDQMIASNLMGAAVWGAGDEVIGMVDDLLLNRDGQIIGVIVGIGGFLGIGERDIAISTDQLEFVLTQDVLATGGVPGAPAGTVAPDPALAPSGTAADGTTTPAPAGTVLPDQTGTAGTTASDTTGMAPGTGVGTGATAVGMNGWTGSVIDHIQVNYTREQLQDAPAFETVE
jgi:hypothetical protein